VIILDSEIAVALIGGAFTAGNVVFTTVANVLAQKKRCKEEDELRQSSRIGLLEDGVQSLLRAEIIRANEKYSEQGYCPYYAKESLTKAYNAYHALGGNDVATELYKQLMYLPDKDRKEIHDD